MLYNAESGENGRLFQDSDLFVLPCIITQEGDRDGLPNVLMEAQAAGLPIVATNVSAVSELIHSPDHGLLVPEKDSEALVRAIIRLAQDNQLRTNIVGKARVRLEQKFSDEENLKQLHQLLLQSQANRKKILFALEATSGGALKHLLYLATHLDKSLFDVTVILSTNRSAESADAIKRLTDQGIKVKGMTMSRSLNLFRDLQVLWRTFLLLPPFWPHRQ